MLQVYYLQSLSDWLGMPDVQTTFVHFDYAIFGSVRWQHGFAALTHPPATRVRVLEPQPPQFKTCLFDVIAKHLDLPFPGMSAEEIETLQWLPAGYTLAEFAAHWPYELPAIDCVWKRLNYYLGLYDWQPIQCEYIHPELDRPLVRDEHFAIESNHAAAEQRLTDFLYSFELEQCDIVPIAPLLYDIRLDCDLGVCQYRELRKVKRLVHPWRIEWSN